MMAHMEKTVTQAGVALVTDGSACCWILQLPPRDTTVHPRLHIHRPASPQPCLLPRDVFRSHPAWVTPWSMNWCRMLAVPRPRASVCGNGLSFYPGPTWEQNSKTTLSHHGRSEQSSIFRSSHERGRYRGLYHC